MKHLLLFPLFVLPCSSMLTAIALLGLARMADERLHQMLQEVATARGIIEGATMSAEGMLNKGIAHSETWQQEGGRMVERMLEVFGTESREWRKSVADSAGGIRSAADDMHLAALAFVGVARDLMDIAAPAFYELADKFQEVTLEDVGINTAKVLAKSISDAADKVSVIADSMGDAPAAAAQTAVKVLREAAKELRVDTVDTADDIATRIRKLQQDMLDNFFHHPIAWEVRAVAEEFGRAARKLYSQVLLAVCIAASLLMACMLALVAHFAPFGRTIRKILWFSVLIALAWGCAPLLRLQNVHEFDTPVCPRASLLLTSVVDAAGVPHLSVHKPVLQSFPKSPVYVTSEMGPFRSGKSATLAVSVYAMLPEAFRAQCSGKSLFEARDALGDDPKKLNLGWTRGIWMVAVPVALAQRSTSSMPTRTAQAIDHMAGNGNIVFLDTEGTDALNAATKGAVEMQNIAAALLSHHIVLTSPENPYSKKDVMALCAIIKLMNVANQYQAAAIQCGKGLFNTTEQPRRVFSIRHGARECAQLGLLPGITVQKSPCAIVSVDAKASLYTEYDTAYLQEAQDLVGGECVGLATGALKTGAMLVQPPPLNWETEALVNIAPFDSQFRQIQTKNPHVELKEWGVVYSLLHHYQPFVFHSLSQQLPIEDFSGVVMHYVRLLNRVDRSWFTANPEEISLSIASQIAAIQQEFEENEAQRKPGSVASRIPFEHGNITTGERCGETKADLCSRDALLAAYELQVTEFDRSVCVLLNLALPHARENIQRNVTAMVQRVKESLLALQLNECNYRWSQGEWATKCDGYCPGTTRRSVECVPAWFKGVFPSRADHCCTLSGAGDKPPIQKNCDEWPQEHHHWDVGTWGTCSAAKCGKHFRDVECRCGGNVRPATACKHQPRPDGTEECALELSWVPTPWSPSDADCACGGSPQTRQYECWKCHGVDGMQTKLAVSECSGRAVNSKGEVQKKCTGGPQWKEMPGHYTTCDRSPCGHQTLQYQCVSCEGHKMDDRQCQDKLGAHPMHTRECNPHYYWEVKADPQWCCKDPIRYACIGCSGATSEHHCSGSPPLRCECPKRHLSGGGVQDCGAGRLQRDCDGWCASHGGRWYAETYGHHDAYRKNWKRERSCDFSGWCQCHIHR